MEIQIYLWDPKTFYFLTSLKIDENSELPENSTLIEPPYFYSCQHLQRIKPLTDVLVIWDKSIEKWKIISKEDLCEMKDKNKNRINDEFVTELEKGVEYKNHMFSCREIDISKIIMLVNMCEKYKSIYNCCKWKDVKNHWIKFSFPELEELKIKMIDNYNTKYFACVNALSSL